MDFAASSAVAAIEPGRFRWQVPDGWQQGKGAFGGLVIGALARAMRASEPDRDRRLRSISAELCGPTPVGTHTIAVTELRRGRGTSYLDARVVADGEVLARASGLYGVARPPSALRLDPAPGAATPAAALAVAPIGRPPTPRFALHYEFRPLTPPPFSGASDPSSAGWLRERGVIAQPRALDDADVLGLLDAWWPCALVVEPAPRPMATVAFTAELLVDPATLDAAQPFLYRAHLAGAADGYSVELRHLWQGDRLIALNQQTFAAL